MPFQYERDDVRHRTVITFEGEFRVNEALASIERRRAERAATEAVLVDIRRLVGQPIWKTFDNCSARIYRSLRKVTRAGRWRS